MDHTPDQSSRDTIFAPASGPLRAGVTVIRVSGPQALSVIETMCDHPPLPRRAGLRQIYQPDTHELLDEALVLLFPGPNSFTGEDVAELHVHGSPAVVTAVGHALLKSGVRMAEPGEFTRRAFENGKMDLTEAEGLADLIDAETERQRAQALRQMGGGLRQTYEQWREMFLDALAMMEGEIDFPDEEDVPEALARRAEPILEELRQALEKALHNAGRGEAIRHGLDVAIIGPPNTGKSTLINKLTQKDAAIVSPIAGTTRDVVETQIEISGLPVRLSDTAGLRTTSDQIESEGIRRAHARADQADIRIGVADMSCHGSDLGELIPLLGPSDLLVLNKSDLQADLPANVSRETFNHIITALNQPDGETAIYDWLADQIHTGYSMTENAGLTRARHRDCVQRALSALGRAQAVLSSAPELAGEDLRQGLSAIKELAGDTDIEMVLDRIFSRFCIGK